MARKGPQREWMMLNTCSLSTPTSHPQLVSLACSRLPFAVTPLPFFTNYCPTACTIQQVTVGLPIIATYGVLQCPPSAVLQAHGLQHSGVCLGWLLSAGCCYLGMSWLPWCGQAALPLLKATPLCLQTRTVNTCVIPYLRTTMGPHHIVLRAAPRSF